MGRQIESAHAYMEQLVFMMETERTTGQNLWLGGPIASLKVLAGNVLERVNREAQQIMGGLGYSKNGRGARIEQVRRTIVFFHLWSLLTHR